MKKKPELLTKASFIAVEHKWLRHIFSKKLVKPAKLVSFTFEKTAE